MATVNEIITDALEIIGNKDPNDTLESVWETVGLRRINSIVDSWNVDKLRGYSVKEFEFSLVSGQSEYTIGAGGDFDTGSYVGRPVRIENAFSKSSSGVNHPMSELKFADFHMIECPTNSNAYPTGFWYNPTAPLGTIKFLPVPSSNYTVHFAVCFGFGSYVLGTDAVSMPQGYERLLTYQLAVELCPHVGKQPPQGVYRSFKKIEGDIEAINLGLWMPSQSGAESNYNNNLFYMERGV